MAAQDRKYRYLQNEEHLDYSQGFDTYLANDVVPVNKLIYATDTRISTLGRQRTRRGCDFYTVPAGETLDTQQVSVTGASNQNFGTNAWIAAKLVPGTTNRLTRLDINIRNTAAATGPVIIDIRSDSSGSPSTTVLAQTSIPASSPTSSSAYLTARFIEAPLLTSGTTYWIVVYVQGEGTNTYQWSSTTSATTATTSANAGVTWSSSTFDMNYKTYLSTNSPTLGQYRGYKSDGTKVTLIAYKEAAGTTAVATVNDATGALTAIKTGLSASATRYEFELFNDVIIYVNGYDAPRKWDFTTDAALGGSPGISSQVIQHKTRLFFMAANSTKVFFSNIADAETYTSTDFVYIPSPKSPDPVTKFAILNDRLFFWTVRTKWVLDGSDISNMVLRKASGQKGTAAPDSVQATLNYIYFASDDNVYQFNGSTDTPIFDAVLGDYQGVANKSTFGSGIYNSRYYLFYTPSGSATNAACWVYNLNYGSMESNDTATYIAKSMTWGGAVDSGQFIQASSLVGALYYGELATNLYNNLGRRLSWELRTKYDHMGAPASNKHVKRWYPRFATGTGPYSVSCQYDKDFAGSPTTIPVSLKGTGIVFGGGALFGGGAVFGNSQLTDPKISIPGLSRFVQRRYKMTGVNVPVEFHGDSLYYFLRRPR
jgi:hypothetical protein